MCSSQRMKTGDTSGLRLYTMIRRIYYLSISRQTPLPTQPLPEIYCFSIMCMDVCSSFISKEHNWALSHVMLRFSGINRMGQYYFIIHRMKLKNAEICRISEKLKRKMPTVRNERRMKFSLNISFYYFIKKFLFLSSKFFLLIFLSVFLAFSPNFILPLSLYAFYYTDIILRKKKLLKHTRRCS